MDFMNVSTSLSEDLKLQGFVMTSVELCEVINKFRTEEGIKTQLQHNNLMKSIRKEIETIENAGYEGLVNFYQSSYINNQNKKQPCFALTKQGTMLMLNKESTLVRYKTQEYIEELEYRNKIMQKPYADLAEDRIKNGFNYKEITNCMKCIGLEDLEAIKPLGVFGQLPFFPYQSFVKQYIDSTDNKYLDKMMNSTDAKQYGVQTIPGKEFISLLEDNNIAYSSIPSNILIGNIKISKSRIKVLDSDALLYAVLVAKGSEVAENFRRYLINQDYVTVCPMNEVAGEKEIRETMRIQKELKRLMEMVTEKEARLNEKEDMLNEERKRLNEKEDRLSKWEIAKEGKKSIKERIKKAFKILFGGETEYSIIGYEVKEKIVEKEVIVEKPIIIEAPVETSSNVIEFPAPSDTRGPICPDVIGRPVSGDPIRDKDKTYSDWKREYSNKVKSVAMRLGIEPRQLYIDMSAVIINHFNLRVGFIPVQNMEIPHFRYGIRFLRDHY